MTISLNCQLDIGYRHNKVGKYIQTGFKTLFLILITRVLLVFEWVEHGKKDYVTFSVFLVIQFIKDKGASATSEHVLDPYYNHSYRSSKI